MCTHHEKLQEPHGYGNLTVVALTILVLGLSVAAVLPPSLRKLANGASNTNPTSNSDSSSLSQIVNLTLSSTTISTTTSSAGGGT
jgi:hypothetical protein